MQGEMIIITTDGNVTTVPYSKKIPLEHLQKAVGGYIERVPLWDKYEGKDCVVYCDEEGKLKGKPMNQQATIAWFHAMEVGRHDDYLVGDIIILTGDIPFMRSL